MDYLEIQQYVTIREPKNESHNRRILYCTFITNQECVMAMNVHDINLLKKKGKIQHQT